MKENIENIENKENKENIVAIDKERIVFCSLIYQDRYNGQASGELSNFMDYNHRCYGHVKNGGEELHLESQVAEADAQTMELDGYTVVWVGADEQEESRIIGWYQNATIYRFKKELDNSAFDGRTFVYNFEAAAKDCYLLKPENRSCVLQGAADELKPIAAKYITQCLANEKEGIFDKVAFTEQEQYKVYAASDCDCSEENLLNRSQFYFESMCYDDAVKDYEKLVELSDKVEYKCGLFNLYMITKQREKAVQCGEKTLEQELAENSPMLVTSGINLAVLYVELKMFEKALVLLKRLKTYELSDYEKMIVVSMQNDAECTIANFA